MAFWKKIKEALKRFKKDLEKESVSQSKEKMPDCCHPPEEIFKKTK
ncbi:MAG: hypothetical protein ACE5OR_12565 [bacterium]